MTGELPGRPALDPRIHRVLDRGPLRAWADDTVDLAWADPAFGERMLREHLGRRHDHASRRIDTIRLLVVSLADWLGRQAGSIIVRARVARLRRLPSRGPVGPEAIQEGQGC